MNSRFRAVAAMPAVSGHGYEGTRRMVLIFICGSVFGLLAPWRKSLETRTMANPWHDAVGSVFLFIAGHKGHVPMR